MVKIEEKVNSAYNKIKFYNKRIKALSKWLGDEEGGADIRLADINKLKSDFDVCVEFLIDNIKEEEFDELDKSITEFEKCFLPLAIALKSHLPKIDTERKIQPKINLPDISIPYFDGNPLEWIAFRDTFISIIHFNDKLDNIVKFTYLINKLKGDAKAVLGHITLTSEGYIKAWEDLKRRFDNVRVIIDKHIDCLFNLKTVPYNNAKNLREIINQVISHTSSLEVCNQKIEGLAEQMLINLIWKKLDYSLRKDWEDQLKSYELPKWNSLLIYLENRCRVLESLGSQKLVKVPYQERSKYSTSNTFVNTDNKQNYPNIHRRCALCKGPHFSLTICPQFLKRSISDRLTVLKQLNKCTNCLNYSHNVRDCNQNGCGFCNLKHHTLLHYTKNQNSSCNELPNNSKSSDIINFPSTSSDVASNNKPALPHVGSNVFFVNSKSIILSTAVVLIKDNNGYHEVRCLLDSGSQSNLISKTFIEKYNFDLEKMKGIQIFGLNLNSTDVCEKLRTKIMSCHNNFEVELEFLVVPKISNCIPSQSFNIENCHIPKEIILADPNFNISSPIDMIIGAELFLELFLRNKYKFDNNSPTFQETLFGYIVSGKCQENNYPKYNFCLTTPLLDDLIKKFWEVESYSPRQFLSNEEQLCENYFIKTIHRDSKGRYTVRLPLNDKIKFLGSSKDQALKRFNYLENKFVSNHLFKKEYSNFIKEYIELGHMKLASTSKETKYCSYFLPHHAIIKPSSTTTKLRVVFDASAKSSTNISLNDVLRVGPTIQQNIFDIVLRFRKYTYVVTADICKMYRQINIAADQFPLQSILWRFNPDEQLETYHLTTVTYGTSSAPYLATRVLKQLAIDEKEHFPLAANILENDFYIDDVLTGSNDINSLFKIYHDLSNLCKAGGFDLRKWTTNSHDLLSKIPKEYREIDGDHFNANYPIKTLGLIYYPNSDTFAFNVKPIEASKDLTKRMVISDIAKLYDPLGILAPVIITFKIFIQSLWKENLDWDEIIPVHLSSKWELFRSTLCQINKINLKRCIASKGSNLEIHGFADASEIAYGACVYMKSISSDGNISVELLCSKSRVALLKTLSIPRLELCAALLLARLINNVIIALQTDIKHIYLWSDSTITLSWIQTSPHKLKTFIANRINEIQELTADYIWNHVNSVDNPADLVSRGVLPSDLKNLDLWWKPPFLFLKNIVLLNNIKPIEEFDVDISELKLEKVSMVSVISHNLNSVIEKYSNFNTLVHVIAYCNRIFKVRLKTNLYCNLKLSSDELNESLIIIVKSVQQVFSTDIKQLLHENQLNPKSKLLRLNPFLDNNHILRVGGRLKNTCLSYDNKHQILLPAKHHFTELIFRTEHIKNIHAAPQLLLSLVRQKYWPIDGKNCANKIVRQCINCFKANPKIQNQIMGSLPAERVVPAPPFHVVGVDLCGPFYIKTKRIRNSPSYKAYVACFVCFVTKAIHLEIVSDLTSHSFLACLKRFIFRRGKCKIIWSDNATNFVGCKNELMVLHNLFENELTFNDIRKYCDVEAIEWIFIPPRSPNFGGLWESAIKSFKNHLKRTTSATSFTYEEFNTMIIQIEGIMNSRPLTPMSTDPNGPEPLTPSHFLIGKPITAPAEPSYIDIPDNRLDYFKRITKLTQLFWKRFSKEYLHNLQQRNKWKLEQANIKINDIVLIVNENLPTNTWVMGRVVETFLGSDKKVRVVVVKTSSGNLKRSISKVCKLPLE